MTNYALGCKRRTTLKLALPGWAAARSLYDNKPVWTDPGECDYSAKLPADIGMLGNSEVGDCVFAAGYHLIQVLSSWARGVEITEPDDRVFAGYSELTGYDPAKALPDGSNPTDQGTEPDAFFRYAIATGLPITPSPAPRVRHKFIAAYEVDYHKIADVREAIDVCGAVFVAFQVPAYIMPQGGAPLKVWDVDPAGDQTIVGGHMVLAPGFRRDGTLIIASWGERDYAMTPAFLAKFGNQVNPVIDPTWMTTTGKSPFGQTPAEIEAQMAALARP